MRRYAAQGGDFLQARQGLFRKGARLADREIKRTWRNRKPRVSHNDLHPCNVKIHRGTLSIFEGKLRAVLDAAWTILTCSLCP